MSHAGTLHYQSRATWFVAPFGDTAGLFNNTLPMNPFLIYSSNAVFDDPATVRVLIVTIRLCLQLPGSVSTACHDDVGTLLHALVSHIRDESTAQDAGTPEWVAQFDEVSQESDYDSYVWIGQSLSRVTKGVLPMYQAVLARLEQLRDDNPLDVAPNVRHLGQIFDFNETETRILELAACAELSSFGFRYLNIERPIVKVYRALAVAVGMPVADVQLAFDRHGRLARSGMFRTSFGREVAISDILDLSSFGKQVFSTPFAEAEHLFQAILDPLPAPVDAAPLHWPALVKEQRTVQAILDTALQTAEPGVNLLLYGAPGTGKTEFAKHLVRTSRHDAYEVPYKDKDGNEASRLQRLTSLHTAQCMLGRPRAAVLVLDEAEDIFQDDLPPESGLGGGCRITGSKAWMNRFLETNPHPVIWITNSIDGIDAAYLRRFTFCMHFDTPHASVRRQIAQQHLTPVGVTDALIASVTQRREFSPAVVAASARAAQLAAGKAGTQDEVVMCHLNSHAKTLQLPPMSPAPPSATRFDTAYLQVEGRFSAQQIMDAVIRRGAGTVLMSGPPGTGKTQLARAIAERSGRELLYFTASDINRKWFGESEQQVARMFAACNPEEQVIFLDEAETVLGARENAMHRGVEAVTAEFLRQLESFCGVFLCAINHGRLVDSALIRRFTFRLEFKPLSRTQRERMLKELATLGQADALPEHCRQALARLDGLTPGDFANVKKRFELIGQAPTLDDWLAELQLEWRAKPGNPSSVPLGFV